LIVIPPEWMELTLPWELKFAVFPLGVVMLVCLPDLLKLVVDPLARVTVFDPSGFFVVPGALVGVVGFTVVEGLPAVVGDAFPPAGFAPGVVVGLCPTGCFEVVGLCPGVPGFVCVGVAGCPAPDPGVAGLAAGAAGFGAGAALGAGAAAGFLLDWAEARAGTISRLRITNHF
jgi:hypothetical protein